MLRLIDGDALKDRFEYLADDDWNQGTGTTWANAFRESADVVEDMPTIDAVEVVRCRECEFRYEGEYRGRRMMMCDYMDPEQEDMMSDDDFCSRGRKNDG